MSRRSQSPRLPSDQQRLYCRGMDDTDKDPEVVIMYLAGRVLKAQEIHAAFGLSRSGYRKAQEEERLITADNMLRVAAHLNINSIELMSRLGLINAETIEGFMGRAPDFSSATTILRTGTATAKKMRHAKPLLHHPPL